MGQMMINKKLFVEYCLLIFVILWSGGSVTYGTFAVWPYVMTIVAGIIAAQRGIKLKKNTWMVIGLFSIVTVAQMLRFGGGITSIAAPILSIVSIALIANIIRPNFCHIFVRVIAFFALISLVFWLIDLFPQGHSRLYEIAKTIPQFGAANIEKIEASSWAIYQHHTLYFYSVPETLGEFYQTARNPGPFYEPGRFTIVLTMAMAIILLKGEYKRNKFLFFVILAANISTFSTTGYYAMLILFVCLIMSKFQSNPVRVMITSSLIIIVGHYVFQTEFMSEKLMDAMETTDEANTRFGAMIYHWSQIVHSPLIGFGNYLGSYITEESLSPCGVTEMMRRWGIPLFILCVYQIYKSAKVLFNNKFYSIAFTLIMLVLAYTQTIMSAPLYYLLYMFGEKTNLYYDRKKI